MTEFRKTALGRLMSGGQAKSIYEQIMITGGTYEAILNKCKEYAQLRRQEHNHKKHKEDMDLDEVGEFSEEEEYWQEERGDNLWQWELSPWGERYYDSGNLEYFNSPSKGKSKGKGKQGKGYSKGGYKRGLQGTIWRDKEPRQRKGQRQGP